MRRRLGAAIVGLAVALPALASDVVFADAAAAQRFVFPRDHGAHPDFRTEWWYVTGWLKTADGEELGFQVTFFRSRLDQDDRNPSRFAPRQLLFAHAALADPKSGRLAHDQRVSRAGFGIAEASTTDAGVTLDGWRFGRVRDAIDPPASESPPVESLRFATRVDGDGFGLDLDLRATGPLLAQGADAARPGYSRKGPVEREASRYYSVPQLAVSGTVARGEGAGRTQVRVTGTAWLDREWSSAYLDPAASGWDWVGLNFDDGGALMAFRMRDRAGGKLWAGGARRLADGRVERYAPGDVDFETLRSWRSPRSRAAWPVQQRIAVGGTGRAVTPLTIVVDPMMDDQELDSRASTGTIYWEGAVRVREGAGAGGRSIGSGYLEMTGYVTPIRF